MKRDTQRKTAQTSDMTMRRFWGLLVLALCFAVISPMQAFAATSTERIRVGVYELKGFHSFRADGNCAGYDVDYLSRIANVTGWRYQYVKADSWSDAMDMLRTGQIDLLAPSQMTTERLQEFNFSSFPIGKVYAAILTTKSNQTIYEDFDAFASMTFGIEGGTTYTSIFEEYAQEHEFSPHIQFYNNHSSLIQALYDGEVDAIVANVMRVASDMRLLGKAGTAPFYYMYRKDAAELGNELDHALDQIEIDEPSFQDELVRAYYPIYHDESFSKAELEYAENLPTIRVACHADARPYSYLDEKNGKLKGILIDYLRQSGESVGIRYEFIPSTQRLNDAFIQENNIQLCVESGLSPIEKNHTRGVYSNNILNTQQLIVCAPNVTYSIEKPLKIAWFSNDNMGNRHMISEFSNFIWVSCSSVEDCFQSVITGRADGCLVNQYAANWYLSKPRYENLCTISNTSVAQSTCLKSGVSSGSFHPEDATFISILNKSFKQLSDTQEQQIVIKYTTAMPYQLTFQEVCYKYRIVIVIMIALLLLIIIISMFYARSHSRKAAKDVLTGLYNRTSAKKIITKQIHSSHYKAGALLLLDLDYFKSVNDTLGHQAGDRLLIETAQILTSCCRRNDVVCRLGGDEFLLYLTCDHPHDFLPEKLEQIRKNLKRSVSENGQTVNVSCSIGAALVPQDGSDFDILYKCADQALYTVKENGRNGYAFYS